MTITDDNVAAFVDMYFTFRLASNKKLFLLFIFDLLLIISC